MNTSFTILKYYAYGFCIAALLGGLIFIYGQWIDDAYDFNDFSIYLKVNALMAIPSGFHVWIIRQMDNYPNLKNKKQQLLITITSYYWLGCIISFILFIILQFIAHLNEWDQCYYYLEDHIFYIVMFLAIPLGLLLYCTIDGMIFKKDTKQDTLE
jgi:undecaprenyl pyrophosphate phosphatase UppP